MRPKLVILIRENNANAGNSNNSNKDHEKPEEGQSASCEIPTSGEGAGVDEDQAPREGAGEPSHAETPEVRPSDLVSSERITKSSRSGLQ